MRHIADNYYDVKMYLQSKQQVLHKLIMFYLILCRGLQILDWFEHLRLQYFTYRLTQTRLNYCLFTSGLGLVCVLSARQASFLLELVFCPELKDRDDIPLLLEGKKQF